MSRFGGESAAIVLRALMASVVWMCVCVTPAWAARIKDIAHIQGVRENQLMGYGLVVGLQGTGDMGRAELTVQTVSSMLIREGIRVDKRMLQQMNVAAVMVTAELPPFAAAGQRIDVTVSSMGNARSLQGGTLLMAPLKAADGQVWAVAQGALTLGGWAVDGNFGNTASKNHVTAGRIPEGALVERTMKVKLQGKDHVMLHLRQPDFTTAVKMAQAINTAIGSSAQVAKAQDATSVRVEIPENMREDVASYIAGIEILEVQPDAVARVIINERTGTVVLGGEVKVRPCAVAHGNLKVNVGTSYNASQPAPILGQGQTVVTPQVDVNAKEASGQVKAVPASANIVEVVAALNALGVTPRDLVAILQAMKAAGALDARLEVQ